MTERRKHVSGAATRILLLQSAEQLFATRDIEGVTLREIQESAGQSNASVVAYHFGSRTGLVQALISWRSTVIDQRRDELLTELRDRGLEREPRSLVWVLVRPLVDSIAGGEMFVPFLARLAENPRANTDYWPPDLADWTAEVMEGLVGEALQHLPDRLRRGRVFQLYNSVLNLLGEQARARHPISEAQLHNYVDAWVGMLTAPVSDETRALLG
jgi:AcrR family transcriptional regulator